MNGNCELKIACKGFVGHTSRVDSTFVRKLYAGSTSGKKLTQEYGVLNHFFPGDYIMADNGCSELLSVGVNLNVPQLQDGDLFTIKQEGEKKFFR